MSRTYLSELLCPFYSLKNVLDFILFRLLDFSNISHTLPQFSFQFLEALQCALEVFDDVVGEFVGRREVIEVGKGLILDPEDVEACLVALQDFFDFEFAETAFGIFLFVVGFLAFKTIFRIVALDEVLQILVGKRILL